MRALLASRQDIFGTTTRKPAWRLEELPEEHVRMVDLLIDSNLDSLLDSIRPRTIFNCVAYGAYSFEVDSQLIYRTNFNFVTRLLPRLESRSIACYVHAGSSSEYGDNASGPTECDSLAPNSDYAVSKVAAANLIYFYGKRKQLPCANLRLYSVYGPLEDSSRLIPSVVQHGLLGTYPQFVNPAISRDFVYVNDVTEAFIDTALGLGPAGYGESINIGSGRKTTIGDVAETCRELFKIDDAPSFTMPNRGWDVQDWYANIAKAKALIGWEPRTTFVEGLKQTVDWYRGLPDKVRYQKSSKKFGLDTVYSVSAIVACYKDNLAIPIMYERLKTTFTQMNIDFEIIFVNDCSPDDSEEVIRAISGNDRRVIGISHSRNFGSQAAFRSGMEIASKNACVLLDGDLQDPPELIEQFVARWREGYDVIYGRRVRREASLFMQFAYKAFYRVFDFFSYIPIPRCRRLLADGPASCSSAAQVPRAGPLSPWHASICRVQASWGRLCPAGADVRCDDQQLPQEYRLGQEGDSQLHQHPAEHAECGGDCPLGSLMLAGDCAGDPTARGTRHHAARLHDHAGFDSALWLGQYLCDRAGWRIHCEDLRGGEAPAPIHSQEPDARR